MDWRLIASATVHIPKLDTAARFQKLIELWRDHCNAINRRLSGIKLLNTNDQSYSEVLSALQLDPVHDVEVRKFVPRSDHFSDRAFEASILSGELRADFWSCVLDGKRHPHVPFNYQLVLEVISCSHDNLFTCELQVFGNGNEQEVPWMRDFAFPSLLRWLKNITLDSTYVESHRLIGIDEFTQTYRCLKENMGRKIASSWQERTDPQKFVFEDCAIAAYLIELWRARKLRPECFCDVGCGNGLLVHLLCSQKYRGYGVDIRRRNIWDDFKGTDLRQRSLNPEEDILEGTDFLIGNHSDELTPWIPILAARSRCNFFVLPCCPFDFYARYERRVKAAKGDSCYGSYLVYMRNICERLGFKVEEDRLKIPSTKRYCIIGFIPDGGLPFNVEQIIETLLSEKKSNGFVVRPKIQQVRNCSQLPIDLRQELTLKVFNYLLKLNTNETNGWHRGGTAPLSKVFELLSTVEREHLKYSNGGLQTFLKNQHQVFKVTQGNVAIRDWAMEGTRRVDGKTKTTACWFKLNHPNGCPLPSNLCSHRH